MCGQPVPWIDSSVARVAEGLDSQGLAWFVDFSQSDPYCLLPLSVCLLHLANIQFQFASANHDLLRVRIVKFGLRCAALVSLPVGSIMPSLIVAYWGLSAVFSLCLNIILKRF